MAGRAIADCRWLFILGGVGKAGLRPPPLMPGWFQDSRPGMQQAAGPRRRPALERVQGLGWGREHPVSHPGMWAAGGAERAGRG